MSNDPSRINPAWRRIESIDADWYLYFDRDDKMHTVNMVMDLSTLNAHGWDVYVAPNAVGTQWVRLYYPHTEDGPEVNAMTGDYNPDAAQTHGSLYCQRLYEILHGLRGPVRVTWGPLPATGSIVGDTSRRYFNHRAVCRNPDRHDEIMRVIVDLEHIDAQRVICHGDHNRVLTADNAATAIAHGIRCALNDAVDYAAVDAQRYGLMAAAFNLEALAAVTAWSPWRIDADHGEKAWGPNRRTPLPPRRRMAFRPRAFWDWIETQTLNTHCHALSDEAHTPGAKLPNFSVTPRWQYQNNACRFVSEPGVVPNETDNHWSFLAGTHPPKVRGHAFGPRHTVVREAFALLSKHKESTT